MEFFNFLTIINFSLSVLFYFKEARDVERDNIFNIFDRKEKIFNEWVFMFCVAEVVIAAVNYFIP